MDSNPALGLLGFWMMMQLAATIALLLGGIYALFCLGRAASGLDRMASAMEEWVAKQNAARTPILPTTTPPPPLAQRMNLPPEAPASNPPATPVSSSASSAAAQAHPAPPANPTSTSPVEYPRPNEPTA